MSEGVEQGIRSQREQELLALREKGLAKTRKTKINDFASPMTTPEQSKRFLATMRDKSKAKEVSSEYKPPTNLSADGVDAWYMMQRQREQEMRRRREEAAALLRGYRAPYNKRNRKKDRGRASMGDELSESLTDPSSSPVASRKRRQSTMPRLEHHWPQHGSNDGGNFGFDESRNPAENEFDPLDRERYSMGGRDYFRTDDRSLVSGGSRGGSHHHDQGSMRSGSQADFFMNNGGRNNRQGPDFLSPRELNSAFNVSNLIDTTESENRLNGMNKRKELQAEESLPLKPQMEPTPAHEPAYPHVVKKTLSDDVSRENVPETVWRDFISNEPGAKFPPEKGRYHLYASYACPGSHRALIIRALKGLEDVVSVTIVHPTWRHTNPANPDDKHRGWVFGDPNGKPFQNTSGRGGPFPAAYEGNEPDPIFGAFSIRELYDHAKDTSRKYTIPLLWDKKNNTIVNNESSDISYMLNTCFNMFSNNSDLDLYTEDDEDGLDKLNEVSEWLYPMMIHGVYRCGFAKTQEAYDNAIEELTEAFDMADELLQNQRYLTGNALTDADIRLFVTLLRFDEVYAFYFRANTRLVMLTPALLDFCREMYQMPGVAETCQMEQIKAHFFGSHAEWNKYSVIPRGLGFTKLLAIPHTREEHLPVDK